MAINHLDEGGESEEGWENCPLRRNGKDYKKVGLLEMQSPGNVDLGT
jgi:hypothetical protein